MVLIGWTDAGHLELLGEIVGSALTAHVIWQEEIAGSIGAHPQNQQIIDAPWLSSAKVVDGDTRLVARLLEHWKSPPYTDRGEAEIVALCRRHGWTAITDDKDGRSALEAMRLNYAHRVSMLLAATAMGVAGLDADRAWEVHHAVEASRDGPFLYDEGRFRQTLDIIQRLWEQTGRPAWPQFLRDWKIDYIVDKADGREPPRPSRS
jgi:predicted nucleic acid-binding protein